MRLRDDQTTASGIEPEEDTYDRFQAGNGAEQSLGRASYLIDVLPCLYGFLLVRNQTKQIAGIITIADVAAEYGATARPFLLIGDLDRQLRRVISEGLDLQEVITLCDPDKLRNITSFGQMAYGDYQRVLSNQ